MTDREIISMIFNHCIIMLKNSTKIERKRIYTLACKLSNVASRLNEEDICKTPAFYIDSNEIFHSSSDDYPLEYCDDESEYNSIFLYPEDILLLNKIYLDNKNDLNSLNKILSIDINNRIRNKKQLVKEFYNV